MSFLLEVKLTEVWGPPQDVVSQAGTWLGLQQLVCYSFRCSYQAVRQLLFLIKWDSPLAPASSVFGGGGLPCKLDGSKNSCWFSFGLAFLLSFWGQKLRLPSSWKLFIIFLWLLVSYWPASQEWRLHERRDLLELYHQGLMSAWHIVGTYNSQHMLNELDHNACVCVCVGMQWFCLQAKICLISNSFLKRNDSIIC